MAPIPKKGTTAAEINAATRPLKHLLLVAERRIAKLEGARSKSPANRRLLLKLKTRQRSLRTILAECQSISLGVLKLQFRPPVAEAERGSRTFAPLRPAEVGLLGVQEFLKEWLDDVDDLRFLRRTSSRRWNKELQSLREVLKPLLAEEATLKKQLTKARHAVSFADDDDVPPLRARDFTRFFPDDDSSSSRRALGRARRVERLEERELRIDYELRKLAQQIAPLEDEIAVLQAILEDHGRAKQSKPPSKTLMSDVRAAVESLDKAIEAIRKVRPIDEFRLRSGLRVLS